MWRHLSITEKFWVLVAAILLFILLLKPPLASFSADITSADTISSTTPPTIKLYFLYSNTDIDHSYNLTDELYWTMIDLQDFGDGWIKEIFQHIRPLETGYEREITGWASENEDYDNIEQIVVKVYDKIHKH